MWQVRTLKDGELKDVTGAPLGSRGGTCNQAPASILYSFYKGSALLWALVGRMGMI
jgi:hypothetical protein